MLFIKFILFFLLISKEILGAGNLCKVSDITNINLDLIQCENNDLLFGYFEFPSQEGNFLIVKIKKYNIEVIKEHRKIFEEYIESYCIKEKNIRIKNITNYNKIKNIFNTEVIVTCYLRK